jgi:demethylmenaquinone methyltransferase/2-methoxy-6-polyprenyl-1,4-benzoquinol methylase
MNRADSIVEIFNDIAPVYDRLNRIISWGQDQRWRHRLAERLRLQSGYRILDVSAGTGDVERALKSQCSAVEVVGLDPSPAMVAKYRQKISSASICQGTAERLPFRSESFDRAVCCFGLRNFRDRGVAINELHRILKPKGWWGFLEMSAPQGAIFPQIYSLYFKRIVPLIGALLSPSPAAYRYLRDSVYAFPGCDSIVAEHQKAGFSLDVYQGIFHGAVGLYVFRKP